MPESSGDWPAERGVFPFGTAGSYTDALTLARRESFLPARLSNVADMEGLRLDARLNAVTAVDRASPTWGVGGDPRGGLDGRGGNSSASNLLLEVANSVACLPCRLMV